MNQNKGEIMSNKHIVIAKWSKDSDSYVVRFNGQVLWVEFEGGPETTNVVKLRKTQRTSKSVKPIGSSDNKGGTNTTSARDGIGSVTEDQEVAIVTMSADGKTTKEIKAALPKLSRKQIQGVLDSYSRQTPTITGPAPEQGG